MICSLHLERQSAINMRHISMMKFIRTEVLGSEFHKGKRFIQEVLKVVQAGLAENATPEDRETMALLLSDDLEVSGGMMDSIMQVIEEESVQEVLDL